MTMGQANWLAPEVAPDPGKKDAGAGGTRIAADRGDDGRLAERLGGRVRWVRFVALSEALLATGGLLLLVHAFAGWHVTQRDDFRPYVLLLVLFAFAVFAVRVTVPTPTRVTGFVRASRVVSAFLVLAAFVARKVYDLPLAIGWTFVAAAVASLAGSLVVAAIVRRPRARPSISDLARVFGPRSPVVPAPTDGDRSA